MRAVLPSLLLAALLTGGCGQRFDDHAGFSSCMGCHEDERPTGHHEGQECMACHGTRTWDDGNFDHDRFFPTPHHGVSECADCHLGGDTTDFTCTDCHEHSQANTDDEHDEIGNYTWESHACLACHPRGEEDDR